MLEYWNAKLDGEHDKHYMLNISIVSVSRSASQIH